MAMCLGFSFSTLTTTPTDDPFSLVTLTELFTEHVQNNRPEKGSKAKSKGWIVSEPATRTLPTVPLLEALLMF